MKWIGSSFRLEITLCMHFGVEASVQCFIQPEAILKLMMHFFAANIDLMIDLFPIFDPIECWFSTEKTIKFISKCINHSLFYYRVFSIEFSISIEPGETVHDRPFPKFDGQIQWSTTIWFNKTII